MTIECALQYQGGEGASLNPYSNGMTIEFIGVVEHNYIEVLILILME